MRVVDRVKCRAGRRGSVLLRDCVKSKRGRTVRDRIPEVITFFFLAMFFLSFRNVVATHQTSFFAIECMIDQCLPVPYMTLMSVRSCSIFPSVVHQQIKPQSYISAETLSTFPGWTTQHNVDCSKYTTNYSSLSFFSISSRSLCEVTCQNLSYDASKPKPEQ